MVDPIVAAAQRLTGEAFDTLRRVVTGLSAEALNWRPADEETNSIAVLATHSAHATRLLVHVAFGLEPPRRDRPAEFTTAVESSDSLLHLIDEFAADCDRIFGSGGPVDWSERRRRIRDGGEVVEESAAYVLIHAVDHLRGHADEASLTRHVWTARS